MRRSLVNSKVTIRERLVLPRLGDVMDDNAELLEVSEHDDEWLVAVLDFADAFKHLSVAPEEQAYLSGRAWHIVFMYLVVLFGIGSGPLIWGRVAAAALRITQAVLGARGRAECFVDDTILILRGKASEMQTTLRVVILLWRTLGLQLAWRKVEKGLLVSWIGAQIELVPKLQQITVSIPQEKVKQLQETCSEILNGRGMVDAKTLRTFAGRGSWMGGLLPQLRPFYRQFWGALAAPGHDKKKELVYVRQVEPSVKWLMELAKANNHGFSRTVCVAERGYWGPTMAADASPWGGGALLWLSWPAYARNEEPSHYLMVEWDASHEKLISGKIGTPDHQASWEALMYVLALRTWVSMHTKGQVTIIGDASGVIFDLVAMRAKSVVVNNLLKEAAMHLAPLGLDLFGVHIWSERNTAADELSRASRERRLPAWLARSSAQRTTPYVS